MNYAISRISLDINSAGSGVTVHCKRFDTARKIYISLVDGGFPYTISEDCYSFFTAKKPDGHVVINDCSIENNTIVYKLTKQTVAAEGRVNSEIELYGGDGALITSPKFTIMVSDKVYNEDDVVESSDDFSALAALIAETKEIKAEYERLEEKSRSEDAPAIVCDAAGSTVQLTDAADRPLKGLFLYGKTVQNGTPTPEAPIPLMTAGATRSIFVDIAQTGQSLALDTPNGLPGIKMQPTCEEYNFVDAEGNKWFTDEIDLARGKYIQRCFFMTFDGSENWVMTSTGLPQIGSVQIPALQNQIVDSYGIQCHHICSHVLSVPRNKRTANTVNSYGGAHGKTLQFLCYDYENNLDGWKAYLSAQAAAGTPMTMVLGLVNPVETALPQETIEAYKVLCTAKGETTISNDGPAFMKLSYIADTKLHFEQRLAAISAAILNN